MFVDSRKVLLESVGWINLFYHEGHLWGYADPNDAIPQPCETKAISSRQGVLPDGGKATKTVIISGEEIICTCQKWTQSAPELPSWQDCFTKYDSVGESFQFVTVPTKEVLKKRWFQTINDCFERQELLAITVQSGHSQTNIYAYVQKYAWHETFNGGTVVDVSLMEIVPSPVAFNELSERNG